VECFGGCVLRRICPSHSINLETKGLTTGSYNLNFRVTGDSVLYAASFQAK